jgi:hypothetical protein
MPIVFNSITQFVEQVGRRRLHRSRNTDLDTMTCIFTGPTSAVAGQIPRDRTPHPEYPFMTSTAWTVKDGEGPMVSELTIDYVGKFESGPTLTNTQWHEGSISWSSYVRQISRTYTPGFTETPMDYAGRPTGPQINVQPVYTLGYLTLSYTCRYVIKSIISKYLSRGQDGYISKGIGTPEVLNQVTFITGASTANDKFGTVTASLSFKESTSEQINDLGNGWFEVEVATTLLPVISSSANTSASVESSSMSISTGMSAFGSK